MSIFRVAVAGLALGLTCRSAGPERPAAKIDKQQLESYLRYAEGFTDAVKITVDDPVPTSHKGFSKLVVHVSLGTQKFDRTYYLSSDGGELVNGKIWDLDRSPFSSIIQELPTDGPSFGPADAKVTVVIFSDFQCPYCRQLAQAVRPNIPKFYPRDVRVIFIDFPLESIHPWARAMGEAAHCVANNDNDRFWALHDWIFERQQEFTKENLREKLLAYAKDHNLETAPIGACIDSHAMAAVVQKGIVAGDKLEVQSTPTVFVNGRMLGGAVPWQTLDAVIKLELERTKDVSGNAAGKLVTR